MHKDDIHHTQITIGSNNIVYKGDVGTPTAYLETVKITLNSIISTLDGRFMTMEIKNLYQHPSQKIRAPLHMHRICPSRFHQQVQFNLKNKNGWLYIKIKKGVYGVTQAGKLSNDLLTIRLNKVG